MEVTHSPTLEAIRALLDAARIEYRLVHHPPTRTSEDSAVARGEELRVGAKAILMKTDSAMRLFVLSAARRINSALIKRHLGVKNLRFADKDELMQLTGLEPGAVPPFGRPILPFDLYADSSVFANDRVAFNAGSLTESIVMASVDYGRVAKPTIFEFSRAADK